MTPQTFRVRRLTQTGAGRAAATQQGGGLLMAASNHAGAVYDVNAQEQLLPDAEIIARLKNGSLRSTDLVQVDGAWSTLVDSIPFGDEAAKRAVGESAARFILYGAMALATFGGLVVIVLLRLFARDFR